MVIKLKYGNTNTFFVHGKCGNLLIDTDYAGTLSLFYKEIKRNHIELHDITYVLATHYHPDHIGLVGELMKQGVKLLLIDTQVEYVHYSDKIFSRDNCLSYVPVNEGDAVVVPYKESRTFLHNIGIEGEVIPTPSHSKDSISLILDDGTCFVGDLEPIDYLDAYEDNIELKEDWEHVMRYHPKIIFYAHANEKPITLEKSIGARDTQLRR